jgi:Ca2+-binding RTX toxin-like protein
MSVSLSADGLTAIVGGPGDNVGANFNEGSARVFAWNGTSWVQRGGALTPTDGSTDGEYNDLFGSSVSLSADGLTAIVGGPGDDVGENAIQGSARVFTWNGTSWVQRGGALTPTDGAETDYFGRSVSLSADGLTAIVGGPGDDVGANEDQGSARVFAWNGTSWVQRGEALTPSDGARYEYFGHSVSLSADGLTAIVGGPSDSVYRIAQGSARVFAWNGTSWVEGGPATVVRGPTEGADTLTGTLSPDTLMGLGGNDNITGLAGDDKLLGGDANDTLDGGAGADTLDGGAGNDLFLISDAGDVVLELADGGADTVITAINFTLPNHVEAMLIAEGASGITITGGAGNDVLIGNGLANTFDGGAGDDVILAGNVTLADIYALFAM